MDRPRALRRVGDAVRDALMAVRIEYQAEPIPGYRLIERIGGGGFGEVWKCEAPGGLHKAIKFVYGDLGAASDDGHRAEQELKALSRVKTVRHPYILSLERFDILDGQLLIVMELADRSLWDRYKECRTQGLPGIPREELLGYMEETAEALDLMNGLYQLQHLDIKPQNLFLIHQHVKVADFGLVKDLQGMQASVTGGVTPVYASPETFDGYVSRFSDQYSLAIVFQELLTGQRPFTGNNVRQLIMQHLQSPPNVTPLPPADRPLISRALAKAPEERHPSCLDLVRGLRGTSTRSTTTEVPAAAVTPSRLACPTQETKEDVGSDLAEGVRTSNVRYRVTSASETGTATPSRDDSQVIVAEGRRRPAQELNSDGALFPALVVGLGQIGMQVLQGLREPLCAQLGGAGQVPCVRMLLLDTDPDVVRQATRADRLGAELAPSDVLVTPLNRPSYYLKPRDHLPNLDRWLNTRMLYRIPRSQVTTGVRALGRLAYCDNYRAIAARLRRELEAIVNPQALADAARQTGLGVRTNRPRVYVLCSLAGGTGSGMFLDLAYTARSLLYQMGYDQPDVVGVLFLPPVDGGRTHARALGNTYAALTELSHFARADTCFRASYHDSEAPIQSPDPPFGRCVLLPLPEEYDEKATRRVMAQAGQYLFRDLCSPLGRSADLARAGLSCPPWEARGLYYQTFGLSQVLWPRHYLLEAAGRRLGRTLVQRWISKDSKPVQAAVQTWAQEEWARHELGADVFIGRLTQECVKKLGRPPEALFKEALQELAERVAPSETGPGSKGTKAAVSELTNEEIGTALISLEALVGKPADDAAGEQRGSVVHALRAAADDLVQEWGQKLAEMPVQLIEEPTYRLAGAEEAVRQMVATIEQVLHHHEPLLQDLVARAREAHERLVMLIKTPAQARAAGGGWKVGGVIGRRGTGPTPADILELLRCYAKWRYQALVLNQIACAFVTLRGHLADEMREINFCRVRLGELLRMLEEPAGSAAARPSTPSDAPAVGRFLFPSRCTSLSQAIDDLVSTITPEDLLQLDAQVEEVLKEQFRALVQVCTGQANILPAVHRALVDAIKTWLTARIGETNVVAMFFEHHADEELAGTELEALYQAAAPAPLWQKTQLDRVPVRGTELCMLAVPPGAAGDRFRALAEDVLDEAEIQTAGTGPSGNDAIVFYRETSNLLLADLEQLGPPARDAYVQMTAAGNFTPHARIDVTFTSPRG